MTTKLEAFTTGDRRRFDKGSRRLEKVICKDCGTVQFLQNDDYKSALDEVYGSYDILHDKAWPAEGSECRPRLRVVYEKVSQTICLPETGNMLDIGCGGGESLQHFHQIYPKWNLYGMDIGEQFRENVLGRDKVHNFFSSLAEIKASKIKFDFITINDVLCLAYNSAEILRTVHELLEKDGIFFVKESDFDVNPYLLYEVECCFFCTKQHIESMIRNFDFDILNVDFDMEKKAIGVFSRKSVMPKLLHVNSYEMNKRIYEKKIEYL
ncbi:MAG: class I SAM-dependent methyltransferase, partial [Lachnospiraceae bacterium]|nr:class I SAM-dependent methyltransferase [Lachnospiraceae bacterium]